MPTPNKLSLLDACAPKNASPTGVLATLNSATIAALATAAHCESCTISLAVYSMRRRIGTSVRVKVPGATGSSATSSVTCLYDVMVDGGINVTMSYTPATRHTPVRRAAAVVLLEEA